MSLNISMSALGCFRQLSTPRRIASEKPTSPYQSETEDLIEASQLPPIKATCLTFCLAKIALQEELGK
jgi:hypothetical protein